MECEKIVDNHIVKFLTPAACCGFVCPAIFISCEWISSNIITPLFTQQPTRGGIGGSGGGGGGNKKPKCHYTHASHGLGVWVCCSRTCKQNHWIKPKISIDLSQDPAYYPHGLPYLCAPTSRRDLGTLTSYSNPKPRNTNTASSHRSVGFKQILSII